MQTKKTLGRLTAASFVLAACVAVFAQQTEKKPEASTAKLSEDKVLELSPFVITEDSNVGYLATTTLAGSRLNTKLRDVGASISVLTPELFNDTGATDAATILSYATNTEVVGVQGNYTGGNYGDAVGFNNLAERRNPQSAQRVRGLAQATLTRSFFLTDIPFDTYNTGNVTISRGPNSLLFGLGEAGGVLDNSLKQATSSKSFGEFSIKMGERGSHRETFDYNMAIKPGRLAVRVIGLNDDTNYQQTPTYRKDKRLFGAFDAVVFTNQKSSVLGPLVVRGSFEKGRIETNPPNIIPVADAFSDWFRLPTYSPELIASQQINGQLPGALNFLTNGTYVPKMTFDNRTGTAPSNAITQAFINNQLAIVYGSPTAQTASIGLADPSVQGFIGFGKYQTVNPKVAGLPTSQMSFLTLNPLTQQYLPNYSQPVVMDRNIIDNERMLIGGNLSQNLERFNATNIALEQTFFGGRAGLEVVYDQQYFHRSSRLHYATKTTNRLSIDINEYLPFSNQPNPNVGRLFMYTNSNTSDSSIQYDRTRREATHLTGFYKLDFAEDTGWKKWLGTHNFTGFYSGQRVDNLTTFFRAHWYDIPGSGTDITKSQNGFINGGGQRAFMMMNYVSDSLLDPSITSPSDVRITQYIQNPVFQGGDTFNMLHMETNATATINPATGNIDFYDDYLVQFPQHNSGNGHTFQRFGSTVGAWQGSFFDGNLVALYGMRTDRARTFTASGTNRLPDGEFDPTNLILDSTNSLATERTTTKSLVAHMPRKWLGNLPFNVSAHYSESENASVTAARLDSDKNPLPSPAADTKDYGVTFEFFNNRLSLGVNWYKMNSTNASLSGLNVDNSAGALTRLQLRNIRRAAASFGYDQAGFNAFLAHPGNSAEIQSGSVFTSWDDIYNAILSQPNATQNGNQWTTDVTDDVQVWINPPVGAVATQDYVGKGMEVELVGNITRNWRVMANIGKQTTVTANTAGLELSKLDRDLTAFQTLKLGGLAANGANLSNTVTFEDQFYTTYYNQVGQAAAKDGTFLPEQRKWRANLISTYQFDTGLLKGVTVGGAVRWQGKAAIGYPQTVSNGVVALDVANPYYDDGLWNGDLWLGYTKKLKHDRTWRIQLNVRNIVGDDDYIPVVINPNGELAVVRNSNPQEISLTNTFSF